MMGDIRRCIGCMADIGLTSVCPLCGYIEGSPYMALYLKPGTILNDRYVVGKLLHFNGEGGTYIAFDKAIEAAVQIREYLPDALVTRIKDNPLVNVTPGREPQYKAYMSDFVELAKQLSKIRTLKHIAQVYEIFEQNNTVYAVYEHIDGTVFTQFLSNHAGELSWKEASSQMFSLIKTMEMIHNLGLVHRGISPETIYVTKKGELKLSGFCISAVRAVGSELNEELFTGYASPEQYSSNSWHGSWTDVYSLAAVMYRTLTGTMPPEATTRSINDNLVMPHILNDSIPQSVSTAIMCALRLSPQNRTQTMLEFFKELGKIQEEEKPRPIEVNTKNKRVSRSKYFFITLGITLFLLTALAFMIIFVFNGELENTSSAVSSVSSMEMESSEPESSSEAESSEAISSTVSMGEVFEMPNLEGRLFEHVKNNPSFTTRFSFAEPFKHEFNDSIARGLIISQDIPAGTMCEKGQTVVNIVISSGTRFPSIPDYNNLKVSAYKSELDKLGIPYEEQFVDGEMEKDGYVDSIQGGNVGGQIDIDPEVGNKIIIYVIRGVAEE